jgi:hypothetical protein
VAFFKEALAAFPFRVTHLLTDRGGCFTAEGFARACRDLGVEHRETKPATPKTSGMVERFNGRVQREVLGITIHRHRDLERRLAGFNGAYNARRQRILLGRPPEEDVRGRLAQDKRLANPSYQPPADPCVLPRALWWSKLPRRSRNRTLQALRGVALVAAATRVAEIGDLRRFASPRQLMAWLGLVPAEHSSGRRIRRGEITKAGNAYARTMLVEAAGATASRRAR